MEIDPGEEGKQQQSGRGKNPASLNALSRRGKGRPALPESQIRTGRTFILDNSAWNGLVALAEAENCSVSRLIERLSERAKWLLEPAGNWCSLERLEQLNFSEAQARALPTIVILGRSFEQRTRSKQKRQGKTQKILDSGSSRHSISLSGAGWEGLATLAIGIGKSEAEAIEVLGFHAQKLQQPLDYWLKKPEESIMRQIIAIDS